MIEIFQKRRKTARIQQFKYLRYVFNDHFVLFLLIAVGALAVQYAQWLQHGSLTVLGQGVLVVLASVVSLSFSRIATYVEPADSIFLLAKEDEVKKEIFRSVTRAWESALPIILVVVIISAPALRWSFIFYAFWACALLLVKYILLRRRAQSFITPDNLDWQALIVYESSRQASLLKIYSLFTTVKGLTTGVKRRKYLDIFLPKRTSGTYDFLYHRTYLRSGDYLGLTVRLLILSLFAGSFIPQLPIALVFIALLNYLLIFQLLGLVHGHDNQFLLKIYPTAPLSALTAVRQLIFSILSVTVLPLQLVTLAVRHSFSLAALMIIVPYVIVTDFLAYFYMRYRLKNKKA